MVSSLIAISLLASVSGSCDEEYAKFLAVHPDKEASDTGKTAFCANYDAMVHRNSQNGRWYAGLNKFSDMSDVSAFLLVDLDPEVGRLPVSEVPSADVTVASIDWRSRMPAVKDQGSCGSCWAFSATAVVDFFQGTPHSEQQLGDCSSENMCGGGFASEALQWLAAGNIQCMSSDYPYKGVQGDCLKTCSSGALVSNVQQISGADAIMSVVQNQVVSLGFILGRDSPPFMSYESGVYDTECGEGAGHAVAAVGYNSDYWIMRNSWGSSWGVSGYFYFKKGIDLCSMETWAPVYASASNSALV